ncbi:hypothetical protein IW139_003967 [Coemansia sp. RSA 353]|nr:hypothetical protein LPJ58_001010 [Coemansia sp. RSA 1591]KAJ1766164.1 hypothetical protein LPJ69_000991 [Coemansia sp. RSA 1752]KAJ2182396.1 hypothetical protein GGF45_000869 [Coemansia sp. RSA 551]KAJ2220693.1 hypothetical protein IW143_002146 [Coemansia sp. RSA 520]KAJ2277850.1 hypothetical protein EV176_001969 [Coemansia sp. RSA 451]KAJ2278177.1 hypothetical protein J3F81_000607 [Coemansia sp. RSA 371]KAJ2295207.1 hypothetical protein IW139_003967 [Coemansia sp. RSA 353]KAJ2587135.1 h
MSHSKRTASGATKGSSTSKRARTTCTDPDCTDGSCPDCADGAIHLDPTVLSLPASELLDLAEHEDRTHSDRSIVTSLYEHALSKCTTPELRSRALLRLAEYVGYADYASQAITEANSDVIKGRARVLRVCLDPNNWVDPDAESSEKVEGLDELDKGLKEIESGLSGTEKDVVLDSVVALMGRVEAHELCAPLCNRLTDTALTVSYAVLGWTDHADPADPVDEKDTELAQAASAAAVRWSQSATECSVPGTQIESRLLPVLAYLANQTTNFEACKLRAQIMLVLSGVLDDDDAALRAFDLAVESLLLAHKITPEDMDVVRQLADLDIDTSV